MRNKKLSDIVPVRELAVYTICTFEVHRENIIFSLLNIFVRIKPPAHA